METVADVMKALRAKGNEQTRRTFVRHGAPDDMIGVKVGDLKVIAKQIKGNQSLACELYETGNVDAMYLAGLVADGSQMTKKEIESWAKASVVWHMIGEYTVPWIAGESKHGRSLALRWMKSRTEALACTGWSTYSGILAIRDDEDLDLAEIRQLVDQVTDGIHQAPNRVRYVMNHFVICVGTYVKPLLKHAKSAAKKIGVVSVDMGDTACKVPLASEYIKKVEDLGRVGKKRKTIKC